MVEKEGRINLPIPQHHPHILGQCVLTPNSFSFFGGYIDENPSLKGQDEAIQNVHEGTIYTFSNLDPDQIYESSLNSKYTRIIGASTVFNEEIRISFTFGGLLLPENKDMKQSDIIPTSNLYAYRWSPTALDEKDQKIYFDHTLNFAPKRQLIDPSCCPVDNVYNAEIECCNVLNLHTNNRIYTPELTSKKPSPRCFHSAAWDQKNNFMWIFGGQSTTNHGTINYLNDTWVWSLYTGMWQKIEAKNPPKSRIGASMTILNGKLYLFGGCTTNKQDNSNSQQISTNPVSIYEDSDDLQPLSDLDNPNENSQDDYFLYYLDISKCNFTNTNEDFSDLKWTPVYNVPIELQRKVYGCTIIPYHPTEFQSFIVFSGGSLINIYHSFHTLTEDPKISIRLDQMNIIAYNTQTSEFKTFPVKSSIPEVSYHSAAIDKLGTLYIAGGINTSSRAMSAGSNYVFHSSFRTVNISKFFSSSIESNTSIDHSILFEVSEIQTSNINNKIIDRSYYSDFLEAVKQEIESTSSKERIQVLYNDFLDHQRNHAPIEDFIITAGGLFASKEILKIRIGMPYLPSTRIPHQLINDLILFAYADVIEPSREADSYDYISFRTFIEFCRSHGLMRLIVFEFAANLSFMSPSEFLSLCLDTGSGFDGQPLFSDDHLSSISTLFLRVVPLFHHLVDFSSMKKLPPKLAREILSHINAKKQEVIQKEGEVTFTIPESEVLSDLCLFDAPETIETLNGPIEADPSTFKFDEEDLAKCKYEVVKAVVTSTYGPLFNLGDADDIFASFRLVTRSNVDIDDTILNKMLGNSMDLFINFASSSDKFKIKLVTLLPHIVHFPVLKFALKMIGTNGLTVIHTNDGKRLFYNSSFGSPLPPSTVEVDVCSKTILALFILMYNYRSVVDKNVIQSFLPNFFDLNELADEILTVCATSYIVSPSSLRKAIGEFILSELFSGEDATEEKFLLLFPRLFDAELHEDAILMRMKMKSGRASPAKKRGQKQVIKKNFDVGHIAKLASEDQNYLENLSEEQIKWMIEKSGKVAESACNSNEEQSISESDDEESDDDNTEAFSK